MTTLEDLRENSFFEALPDAYLSKIAELCHEEVFQAQDIIVNEGEEAHKLFILMEGSIAIQLPLKKYHYVIISTLEEKGALFGWSSLVEPKRYSAAVKCLDKTRVLSLSGKELEKLFQQDPVMGLAFMKKIANLIDQRLISMRNRLVSTLS
jgi:CRP-like cAMP-binding protein